ncbi:MAG: MGH1-like glycoside hydrolase domain-containing protein, partial [bacterium]
SGGTAWEFFDHDQARSRAYRWNEDGLGGICDEKQRLCFAISLWNGRDPILKERAFGLTGNQGNHGEDVKEYYFYLDAAPSHSYLRYLYKYPQAEYPYAWLVEENRRRSRIDPPFSLLDTGIFNENRYWDIEIVYAKSSPETVLIRIVAYNRGPEAATLHLLPSLWFRNTWSWGGDGRKKPGIFAFDMEKGPVWAVHAEHPELGVYHLYGAEDADLLFTENETNAERLWGLPNSSPFVKDSFHRRVIHDEESAVNPEMAGTKCAAWYRLDVAGGSSATIDLMLTSEKEKESRQQTRGGNPGREIHHGTREGASMLRQAMSGLFDLESLAKKTEESFRKFDQVLEARRAEADEFYREILPRVSGDDASILRQTIAGLLWTQQFFHYEIAHWIDGDALTPPAERKWGRNHLWRHLKAADVISMPDAWEYPWFAAWDLAFHCVAISLFDIDLAKQQIELLLNERYLHPNGQIPAYEWTFEDVNPPVHAWAALECFRTEQKQRGKGDLAFLRRVFNKLILNYGWWLNRKDPEGRNVFGGGFLGLDNISVYDRSQPLPPGFSLKQADATGWVAMFILNMTVMALELAAVDPEYEEMAIQLHNQFFAMADAVHGYTETGVSLWDYEDKFFKDVVSGPQGNFPLPVYSWVGLIPLFGCEVVGPEKFEKVPRYQDFLKGHAGGKYDGHIICACPHTENFRGEHLFTIVQPTNLPAILSRVLHEDEFLSPHGVRSVSRIHAMRRDLGTVPGLGMTMIAYEPGESMSGLFGGNSNWRGPVWFPLNFLLVQSLDRFHRYLGENFKVPAPFRGGQEITLKEAADEIAERLVNIFRRNGGGVRPAFPEQSPFQSDPNWKDLLLFHEYFHGETGQGLGASHQTGWTALVANLLKRRHEKTGETERK